MWIKLMKISHLDQNLKFEKFMKIFAKTLKVNFGAFNFYPKTNSMRKQP